MDVRGPTATLASSRLGSAESATVSLTGSRRVSVDPDYPTDVLLGLDEKFNLSKIEGKNTNKSYGDPSCPSRVNKFSENEFFF